MVNNIQMFRTLSKNSNYNRGLTRRGTTVDHGSAAFLLTQTIF